MNIFTRAFRTGALFLTLLFSTSAFAQWQGTWDTNYGQIKLRQSANHVYGDYGSWGTIGGVVSQDKRTLRGVYRRNDDGSWGYIEWRLRGSSAFEGRWGKPSQVFPTVGKAGTVWDGTRRSAQLPALSVYNGTGFIGDFMPAQPAIYAHWVRLFYVEQEPVLPTEFNADPLLTPAKLRTAFEMQRVVQAVSKTGDERRSNGEAESRDAFVRMGYELLGDGVFSAANTRFSLLRAAVVRKDDAVVIAFRGTGGDTGLETFLTLVGVDGNITPVPPLFIPRSQRNGALVHAGFHDAYLVLKPRIMKALEGQDGTHVFITGHSLGGALSQLLAWDLAVNEKGRFKTITNINSGAPRVGNALYAQAFRKAVPDNLRIIVNRDPVPTIPRLVGTYVHTDLALTIGKDDGVLLQHEDQDVRAAFTGFGTYHDNLAYYHAVKKLADRAQQNSRLNPNGERWALDAAGYWRELSKEEPSRVKNRARQLLEKGKGLFKR